MACLSFVVPKVIRLTACGFLLLILPTCLICRTQAEATGKSNGNLIRIWSVGSPHSGALPQTTVPAAVARQAEKLGYTIEVENLRAASFAAKLRQAVQEHTEPEILTFDNFGVLVGITTALGRFDGVLSDQQIASSLVMVYEALAPVQPRGWVVLVRSAANYEAAKALAMQPPVCQPELSRATHSPITAELRQAQEAATEAARAYLACDLATLAAVSDEARLGEKCFLPEGSSQIEAVEPCSVTGNRNLAFVSLVSTFTAQTHVPATYDRDYFRWLTETALGHQSLVAVLRNQRGVWRLLAITDDPTNTNLATRVSTQRVSSLLDDGAVPVAAEPAALITPDGSNLKRPLPQRFGDFVWRPSPSADAICEVVEFLVGNQSRVRERTRLFFLLGREEKLSSGLLWGRQGRWRVWSIIRSGNVSFSEQRSYVSY